MNQQKSIFTPPLLPMAFWVVMLVVLSQLIGRSEVLPEIATEGLADVWFFYLPLLIFTLLVVFFFTRKDERPTWESFGINKSTLGRDVFAAIAYLIAAHLLLGGLLNIGLHFPGPDVYAAGTHDATDVAVWAIFQFLAFALLPYLWLRRQGFSLRKLISGLNWRRDIWFILAFWAGEFFSMAPVTGFFDINPSEYWYAIPLGIFVNTLGAGLPVLVMIHLIIIPRLSMLLGNQMLVIMLGGIIYATFSMFDPGVSFADSSAGAISISYIFATQTLIGMGKATFTVRTGNPFIHFTSFHILGARVAFDTAMFADIFRR